MRNTSSICWHFGLFCSTLRKNKPQERYPYIQIYYIYIYYIVTERCFPKNKKKHKGVCASIYTFSIHTILIHIKHNKLMKLPLTLSNLSKIYKKLKLMAHSCKWENRKIKEERWRAKPKMWLYSHQVIQVMLYNNIIFLYTI